MIDKLKVLSLYYRTELVWFLIGLAVGIIIF